MFRQSRREFSLRDSPAKRMKLSNASPSLTPKKTPEPILSNLSLRESPARPTLTTTVKLPCIKPQVEASPLLTPKSSPEPVQLPQEDSINVAELDNEIEEKLKELGEVADEFTRLQHRRFKYDDHCFMVKRLGDKIRNQLNSIWEAGNKLAVEFQDTFKEMKANHKRRFATKSLEWNNFLDQLGSAMAKKSEELKLEISLQRRTLEHKQWEEERMAQAAKEMNEVEKATESEPEKGEAASMESLQSLRKSPVNMDDHIQGSNNIDCITLDESDDPVVEREEVVTGQSSGAHSEVREDADEDATDVEENQDEETASFTPCQAQRVD